MGDDSVRMTPAEFVPYARFLLKHDQDRVLSMLTETSRYDSPELAEFWFSGKPFPIRQVFGSEGLLPEVRTRLVQLLSVGTLNRLVLPKGSLYSKFLVLEHPEVASLLSGSARKHLVLNQDMRVRYRVAANPSFSRDERVEALCGYRSRGGPASYLQWSASEQSVEGWRSLLPFSDDELDALVDSASPSVVLFTFRSLWDLPTAFVHPRLVEYATRCVGRNRMVRPVTVRAARLRACKQALCYGNQWGTVFAHLNRDSADSVSSLSDVVAVMDRTLSDARARGLGERFRVGLAEAGAEDPLPVNWVGMWSQYVRSLVGAKKQKEWVPYLADLLGSHPDAEVGSAAREVVVSHLTRLPGVESWSDAERLGSVLTPPATAEELVSEMCAGLFSRRYIPRSGRHRAAIEAAAELGCEHLLWSRVPAKFLLPNLECVGYKKWVEWCRSRGVVDNLSALYSIGEDSDLPVSELVNILR